MLKTQANLAWRRDDEGDCVRFRRYTLVDEMRRKETRHAPEFAVIRSAVQRMVSEFPARDGVPERGTTKFEQ